MLNTRQLRFLPHNLLAKTTSVLLTCAVLSPVVVAATADDRATAAVSAGSTAFCLYELPLTESGHRRWINLGIVQYVEAKDLELIISYGGGGFGSGHESKLALAKPEDAGAAIEKIRKAAAACR